MFAADDDANPCTIGGNLSWANYTVSADAMTQQAGAVQLLGRVGPMAAFDPAAINDYYLQLGNTGAWSIVRNSTAVPMSIPTTMRALRQTSLNGPQDLRLITDAPVPSPGPGEVLIRVTAAGVNYTSAFRGRRCWRRRRRPG